MIRYLKNDIMGPLRQVAKALGYPPLVGLWPAISFKIFKFDELSIQMRQFLMK